MARRANVGQLVLTHYGAEISAAQMLAAATGRFAGSVSIADDGDQFFVWGSSRGSEN